MDSDVLLTSSPNVIKRRRSLHSHKTIFVLWLLVCYPLPLLLDATMFISNCSRAATRLVQTAARRSYAATSTVAAKAAFPAPKLFDYETVTSNLSVVDAIDSVEAAFGALAKGKVDVPMPMHIGIEETDSAGPGDCHISKSR
jgi:hypothetical protein